MVCARIYFSVTTIFANQIFLCHFLEFRARFVAKKEPGFGPFFAKSLLSLTPLILMDYSPHTDTITMEQSILYLKQFTVFLSLYFFLYIRAATFTKFGKRLHEFQ